MTCPYKALFLANSNPKKSFIAMVEDNLRYAVITERNGGEHYKPSSSEVITTVPLNCTDYFKNTKSIIPRQQVVSFKQERV